MARALKEEGRTQEEIGAMLGVPQQTIQRWVSDPNTQMGNADRDNRRKFTGDLAE